MNSLPAALFIYSESAAKLRHTPMVIPPDALHKTAVLFRNFGEDYHEKKLEEEHIFPIIKAAGGPAAVYPDILTLQHNRGREITDYLLEATENKITLDEGPQMILALESFVRMYRPHAAREDTIVFPAWKLLFTAEQLEEMGETFEDIEHQEFGEDGFENAVQQIADIEAELGMTNLAQYTAPPITT